jgi:serine acetyltransferase
MFFLAPLPGALGFFLRGKCYPCILRAIGKGTVFGKSVVLRSPAQISIGQSTMIDDYVVLDAKGRGSSIAIGNQVLLGRNTILSCSDSKLEIGHFVSFGPFCFLASRSQLRIGSNVAVGAGSYFLGGGHAYEDPNTAVIHQARTSQGITVEDNVWIGIGARILDGVHVGRNSIVGAGAVVAKDVPPWTVVMGNPARVVEKRKERDSG